MRVRLNHSQGSLAVELTARGVDDPVVIGRSPEADLQVVADSVSRRHSLMYLHPDGWVVQDAGSREGTFVNGQKIDGPVLLAPGVKVTFGPDGSAGAVEILTVDAPAPAAAAGVAPSFSAPAATAAGKSTGSTAAAGTGYAAPHKRPKKSNGPVIVASVAVVIVLLAIGACIYAVNYRNNVLAQRERDAAEAKKKETGGKTMVIAGGGSKTIFGEGTTGGGGTVIVKPAKPAVPPPMPGNSGTPNVAGIPVEIDEKPAPAATPPATPATPPAKPGDSTPAKPAATPDPAPEAPAVDPAWQKVVDAHDSAQPAVAIFTYLEYKKTSPPPDKLKAVDWFLQEELDELWWVRINELLETQASIDQQIKDLKKEKSDLPGDATKERKEQFDKMVKNLETTKASNLLIIDGEMGFKGTKPIDLDDPKALEAARKARSKELYDRWCERVMSRLKSTRDTPW